MFIQDMPSGYAEVLDYVLANGSKQCSRGMQHREVVGFQLVVEQPHLPLATKTGRKLNDKIAYAEALQLIAGESYPNLISEVSKGSFDRFKDGQVLHGAYGPRLRPQMTKLIDRLKQHDSRQAVVTIWDPFQDMQDRKDLPCTVALQLLLRDDELHMVTTMRSNDAWLGLPYDVFQFTQLQCTLAAVFDVNPGRYVHNVGSMHLYEEHVGLVEDVQSRLATAWDDEFWGFTYTLDWRGLSSHARWSLAQRTADHILQGRVPDNLVVAEGLPSRALKALHA